MNNNGAISFGQAVVFPNINTDIITPCWNDIHTTIKGDVFVHSQSDLMDRAQSDIRRASVSWANFEPNLVFVVTWSELIDDPSELNVSLFLCAIIG